MAMVRVWQDYLMTAGLMFSVIPMMRFSYPMVLYIDTDPINKLLIVLMMLTALGTAFCFEGN